MGRGRSLLAAPGRGVHAVWGPGRAGQHGARLPDDHPLPLPCPLLRRAGQAEVALLCGRALLSRLLQGGAVQLLAGRCCLRPSICLISIPLLSLSLGLSPRRALPNPGHFSCYARAPTAFEREGTVVPLSLGIIPQGLCCVLVASCWARPQDT